MALDTLRAQAASLLESFQASHINTTMIDTLASGLRYKVAGFTDAQVEALVEADRMVQAVREASSQLRTEAHLQTILADH